jgi:hypothetical protein
MRSEAEVREVFRLHAEGLSGYEITHRTGCPRTNVQRWLSMGLERALNLKLRVPPCSRDRNCPLVAEAPPDQYAYLLGQYLGDGHIVECRKQVYRLEIFCCRSYPGIIDECEAAMRAVLPRNSVSRRPRPGIFAVGLYSKHLPCLFPQHGPGMKHTRSIVLAPWQSRIAIDHYPQWFLRGLMHSDGCRGTNTVTNRTGKRYSYPRYQFSNRSADIRELFCEACDRVGTEWRQMNRWTISVARRDSVALLDTFIGPKY